MNLESIKSKLNEQSIYHSDENILGKPSFIGYEKKFKWSWMATQLNTFVVTTDFGDEQITTAIIEKHLTASFDFARSNYSGWPRGLQSGMGVICVLISNNVDEAAKDYCLRLLSGKKWAGFSIPVIYNSQSNELYRFQKNPMWGAIYYPHFKRMIDGLI